MFTITVTPTIPGAISDLHATAGTGQAILSWTTPEDNEVTITEYWYEQNGVWKEMPGSDAVTTSHTVTGLEEGQTYTFKVRAENSEGPADPSNEVTIQTLGIAPLTVTTETFTTSNTNTAYAKEETP